jgi:hypothetical protein
MFNFLIYGICNWNTELHKLPIKFIIEDNNKSVCSDTRKVWNDFELCFEEDNHPMIYYYKYESKYPHAGTGGGRIQF